MNPRSLLFLLLCLAPGLLFSQNYNWSQSIGTQGDYNLNTTPHDTLLYGAMNDSLSGWHALPFPFQFFGQAVTGYKASDNGYLTFDSSATVSYAANDLPPTAGGPNNAIYAFWDDFELQYNVGAVADIVRSWTYGSAPNRVHVVQWHSVTPLGTNGYHYTAVRFYECGDFDVVQNWSNATASTATVGAENANGTQAVVVTGSPSLTVPGMGASNADDIVYTFTQTSLTDEVQALDLVAPTAAGPGTQQIALLVRNNAADTLHALSLHYQVDGGAVMSAQLPVSLPPQASDTVIHPINWTPAGPGNYGLCAWTSLPNGLPDQRTCNDSLCRTVPVVGFNPGCRTGHVVVLGSSTAAGAGPTSPDSAWVNRYRTFLQALNPGNQVTNLAIGGTTTYHIMPTGFVPPPGRPNPNPNNNITQALSLNPDAIIVNMPSNDAATGVDSSETIANFDSLWSMAQNAGVPIYICTTQPRNFGAAQIANQLAVRDYVLATFGNFALDFWNPFANPANTIDPLYDSGDGVHMNNRAHGMLFQKVVDAGVFEQFLLPQAAWDEVHAGASYTFQDLSMDATAWHWDFGDGDSSALASPAHTYVTGGTFQVCLIAMNSCGSDTSCQTVQVCLPPSPQFSYAPSQTRAFTFLPQPGTGVAFHWDFGDGSSSVLPSPTHIYVQDGSYQVCLTYTDSCTTVSYCDSVTVCQFPQASFTYQTPLPYEVQFADQSVDATSWHWDFGDGQSDTTAQPLHIYAGPGSYQVTLIATNACGSDTSIQTLVILPSGIPDPDGAIRFYPNPSSGASTLSLPRGLTWNNLVVYDLLGRSRKVGIESAGGEIMLDGSQLAEGRYLIRVSGDGWAKSLHWHIVR